jgi:hypothetical protein
MVGAGEGREVPNGEEEFGPSSGPIPGRLTRTLASGRSKKRRSISSSTSSMRSLRARISVASSATMRAAIDSAGRAML